jgi:hypothetical protein
MKQLFTWLLAVMLSFGIMQSWTLVSATDDGVEDEQSQEDDADDSDDDEDDSDDDADDSDDDEDDSDDDADDSDDDEDDSDDDADDSDDDEDDSDDEKTKEATATSCASINAQDQVFIDKFKSKLEKVFPMWKEARRMKVKETMAHLLTKLPEFGRVYCIVDALHDHLITLNETIPVADEETSMLERIKAKIA